MLHLTIHHVIDVHLRLYWMVICFCYFFLPTEKEVEKRSSCQWGTVKLSKTLLGDGGVSPYWHCTLASWKLFIIFFFNVLLLSNYSATIVSWLLQARREKQPVLPMLLRWTESLSPNCKSSRQEGPVEKLTFLLMGTVKPCKLPVHGSTIVSLPVNSPSYFQPYITAGHIGNFKGEPGGRGGGVGTGPHVSSKIA